MGVMDVPRKIILIKVKIHNIVLITTRLLQDQIKCFGNRLNEYNFHVDLQSNNDLVVVIVIAVQNVFNVVIRLHGQNLER